MFKGTRSAGASGGTIVDVFCTVPVTVTLEFELMTHDVANGAGVANLFNPTKKGRPIVDAVISFVLTNGESFVTNNITLCYNTAPSSAETRQ